MDALMKSLLLGVSKPPEIGAHSEAAPVEELTRAMKEISPEWEALLRMGLATVYRAAGYRAMEGIEAPSPAAQEKRPRGSARLATMLQPLLADSGPKPLLREALERLEQAGLVLPEELLPVALNTRDEELRDRLAPTLGERGLWLSRFDEEWSWARRRSGATDVAPEDFDSAWEEGTLTDRLRLLKVMRKADPARARQAVEAVWTQERADHRAQFLNLFEIGLSQADEEFLEKALKDRGAKVKAEASNLLCRLSGSALSVRMRERAVGLLEGSKSRFFGKSKLKVHPPDDLEREWKQDGVSRTSPGFTGSQGWWVTRTLELVPPTFWETRFQWTPEELIAAVKSDEWEKSAVEGWSRAVLLHGATSWATPLWDWWERYDRKGAEGRDELTLKDVMGRLLRLLPAPAAAERVGRLFEKSTGVFGWREGLSFLDKPWGPAPARRYLSSLRETAGKSRKMNYESAHAWFGSLEEACWALPPECFDEALEPIDLPESESWWAKEWRVKVGKFQERLRRRRALIDEIDRSARASRT